MSCLGCSVKDKDGTPMGCKSNGGCSTGGCNKLNTFDWLTAMDVHDVDPFRMVEVSFKNGARKLFYRTQDNLHTTTGDMVVVETGGGYDVGRISLSGELVRLQMKKKRVREAGILQKVLRFANQRDLEKLEEARQLEKETMIRARIIARELKLKMKIGDVEYQGDKRKCTFYYTADGRVDFRELIRRYAKAFRVKIEMRQIGARQESARIGGLGSCGRELCCSTWLSDFKSVTTSAARYQNLAINQAKLSGMCGRLKCCLNYELDTYMDALKGFPKRADRIKTQAGTAVLIKTDIFKRIMYYAVERDGFRSKPVPLTVEKVHEIIKLNKKGEKPEDLLSQAYITEVEKQPEVDFESVDDVIDLPPEERRRRRKRKRKNTRKKEDKKTSSATKKDSSENNTTSKRKRKDSRKNRGRGKKKD